MICFEAQRLSSKTPLPLKGTGLHHTHSMPPPRGVVPDARRRASLTMDASEGRIHDRPTIAVNTLRKKPLSGPKNLVRDNPSRLHVHVCFKNSLSQIIGFQCAQANSAEGSPEFLGKHWCNISQWSRLSLRTNNCLVPDDAFLTRFT